MHMYNIYSNIDINGLNKINQEYNEDYYKLKDKRIIELFKGYNIFNTLLNNNRNIKDKSKRLSFKRIQELSNISRATYYRYKILLKNKNWKDIERDKIDNITNKNYYKPINLRKSKIIDYNNINNKELIDTIKDIRNHNPTYSKYKIHVILNRDYKDILNRNINLSNKGNTTNTTNTNNTISISTIGRILSYLKDKRLINGTNKLKKNKKDDNKLKRTRNFNNCYAKPWIYNKHNISDTRLTNINNLKEGDLIQIDHMVIRKNDVIMRQFSAIDPTTRILVSYLYNSANSKNARDFLINKVLKLFPFKVNSIQVDGGSEFMKHFLISKLQT